MRLHVHRQKTAETSAADQHRASDKQPLRPREIVMAAMLSSAVTFVAVVIYIGASKESSSELPVLSCTVCPAPVCPVYQPVVVQAPQARRCFTVVDDEKPMPTYTVFDPDAIFKARLELRRRMKKSP